MLVYLEKSILSIYRVLNGATEMNIAKNYARICVYNRFVQLFVCYPWVSSDIKYGINMKDYIFYLSTDFTIDEMEWILLTMMLYFFPLQCF